MINRNWLNSSILFPFAHTLNRLQLGEEIASSYEILPIVIALIHQCLQKIYTETQSNGSTPKFNDFGESKGFTDSNLRTNI